MTSLVGKPTCLVFAPCLGVSSHVLTACQITDRVYWTYGRRKEGSTLTVLRHSCERIVRSKGDTPPLPSTHNVGSIRDDARGGGMDSGGIGSRRENRSLSHDPYTFECQCQSRETGSHFLPPWNERKSLSETIHKKFSTFLQKRGEGFLKECAKKWAFCAEIKW